jgi:hypothetical protein
MNISYLTLHCPTCNLAQFSAVGIATGYELHGRGGGGRSSLYVVQAGSGAHLASYPMGAGVSFPSSKATGAWSWQLTSNWCRGQECVDLYVHSSILHGVALDYEGESVNGSQIGKNVHFSTYPPATLIHLYCRFTTASKPSTSSSSAKRMPQRCYFSGPNRWKSLGAKSGLLGACSRSSHRSSWMLSWVARAVWAWHCHDEAVHLLPVRLEVFCELHPEAPTELHSTIARFTFSPRFWKWANSIP